MLSTQGLPKSLVQSVSRPPGVSLHPAIHSPCSWQVAVGEGARVRRQAGEGGDQNEFLLSTPPQLSFTLFETNSLLCGVLFPSPKSSLPDPLLDTKDMGVETCREVTQRLTWVVQAGAIGHS